MENIHTSTPNQTGTSMHIIMEKLLDSLGTWVVRYILHIRHTTLILILFLAAKYPKISAIYTKICTDKLSGFTLPSEIKDERASSTVLSRLSISI